MSLFSGFTPVFFLSFNDKFVAELVLIVRRTGKVLGENLTAALNGFAVGIARMTGLQAERKDLHHFIPSSSRNFLINASVRQNFHLMFKQRGENQYPGMCPGIMQPLRGEGRQTSQMDCFHDSIPRNQISLYNWN